MQRFSATAKDHYTLWQMLGIWLVGGAPIWVLAWAVYPALRWGWRR